MFRRREETDAMADVTQERGACRHRLQYPPLLLCAEIHRDATGLGNEPHQGLGLMNIQLINDKEPRGLWISGKSAGDMPRKVFFSSTWSYGGRHDFPRCDVGSCTSPLRIILSVQESSKM